MKQFMFAVWQDGMRVASAYGNDRIATEREGRHYAMMYEQDGPVVLKEGNRIIYRTPVLRTKPEASHEGGTAE